MSIKEIGVKVNSFQKLDDPFHEETSKKYMFYVKVDEVPEGIPMATNPREQSLTSGVAKEIEDSLCSNDGCFHLKNRGIVLSAQNVVYDSSAGIATIVFSDELSHGNIDGGHTYKILCNHKGEHLEQYVQFEVMTGVEDIIENLAEARNTSAQVDAKSMAELRKQFEPVKEAIEGMPFYDRIAFKQNQFSVDDETGKKNRMIDAREIVAIISMFNMKHYGGQSHPIQAYSSKAKMLNLYLEDPESYRRYINVIPDIFDLYDAVECEFAEAYNDSGAGNRRYGRKKYAGYKEGKVVGKSKFGMRDLMYKVPDGFIYPIVAGFRRLLIYNENTEQYEWRDGIEPTDVWSRCKKDIADRMMNLASSIGDNPNAVGKDPSVWDYTALFIQSQR